MADFWMEEGGDKLGNLCKAPACLYDIRVCCARYVVTNPVAVENDSDSLNVTSLTLTPQSELYSYKTIRGHTVA